MPKSKGRHSAKKHRARVNERNLIKKRQEEKLKKDFMNQMQKIQEEAMKQEQEVVNVDDMGDIGDFGLEDAEIIEENNEKISDKNSTEKSI